ncbi:MAG TPA: gamma-glutamyltransferase [Acidimicrobiales bacterium]|nr:gamma-glutamyltransferase [Acidimicrobiales bacterium]
MTGTGTAAPFITAYAPNGMVCAVDRLAAEAGVAMLREGGSAVDAAVAASAVLAVTTQHMCGMGGDLFALVSTPSDPTPACLNASGRAGSGADADRLRAEGHTTMPFRDHPASVPVPGCVDGWVALHERYGRLPLSDVLEPACRYAAIGFPTSPTLAAAVGQIAHLSGAGDYTNRGRLRPGAKVRRPVVALTLAAIGKGGRSAFYEGPFGEGLIGLGDGEYTDEDLTTPLADWVDPLRIDAWGRTLWTVPPNSQGYLTLASAWIAAGLDLPDDPDDPLWAHLLVEATRLAAFDRVDVLHEHADGAALLSPDRLGPRREAIEPDRARTDLAGSPFNQGGTIYLCAVDDNRMGVSLIQSNAAGWGSHLVEPTTRIFLQNRGIGFSLQPGHPAEYGPGRRPPHTLSPALVTHPGGELDMVIGSMGGDGQPHFLLQLLARLLASRNPDPADAIAAARFLLVTEGSGFDCWLDRGDVRVLLEGHAPTTWATGLADRGHAVDQAPSWGHEFGHAHVIRVNGDHLEGASDPRALSGGSAGW